MDIFSVIFLVWAFFALIGGFILEGGHLTGLFSPTSLLIVFGGTIGAVGISFPISELKQVPKMLGIVFKEQKYDYVELMSKMKAMCIQVRQSGLLSLENQIDSERDSLMRKGMRLIVDGTSPTNTREALELALDEISARHRSRSAIFESAGGYSPTMGIIGTVMGLVHVLSDLQDPDTLGPKIANAFLATLYGIAFANVLWLPLAGKLKEKNRQEILYKSMIIEGLLLIQEGVNTNYMEEKLSSFLSDAQMESGSSNKNSSKSSNKSSNKGSKKSANKKRGK